MNQPPEQETREHQRQQWVRLMMIPCPPEPRVEISGGVLIAIIISLFVLGVIIGVNFF